MAVVDALVVDSVVGAGAVVAAVAAVGIVALKPPKLS